MCRPWQVPSGVYIWAKTTACVAEGRPVDHHFVAPSSGVSSTHSSLPAAGQQRQPPRRNGSGGRIKAPGRVEGRGGPQATDVGAMGELRLAVAPN
jgi:hypothetical protein